MSESFSSTLKHSANYLAGSVATKALGFISIPILTRLLTPEEYGVNAIYQSWIPILLVFLTLNSFSAAGRYYYENKEDFGEFLGTSLLLAFGFLEISALFCYFFQEKLAVLIALPSPVLLWFLIPAISIAVIRSLFIEIFQAKKQSKIIAITQSVGAYAGLGITVIIALKLDSDRYFAPIVSSLFIEFLLSGYYLYKLMPMVRIGIRKEHLKYIFSFCLPLILSNLSGLLLQRFDTLMLGKISGNAQAGLYSFAYQIGMLQWVIVSALYVAWRPTYYKYMNNKQYGRHDKDIYAIIKLIFLAGCGLILFGKELGMILASKDFYQSLNIIPLIVIGYLFLAINDVYKRHIVFAKSTIYLFIGPSCSAFINIVLNFIFIPKYGVVAAAFTTMISYFVLAMSSWLIAKYIIRIHCTPINIYFWPFIGIIMSVLVMYGDIYFINTAVVSIVIKIMVFLIVLNFIYRKEIVLFLKNSISYKEILK